MCPTVTTDKTRELRIPREIALRAGQMIELADSFCANHLDQEYGDLCRRALAQLARKRPSPLARGREDIWAMAAVYAVGSANFLFDPGTSPHLSGDEISELSGVARSTLSAKARTVRDLLRLDRIDHDFMRADLRDRMLGPLAMLLASSRPGRRSDAANHGETTCPCGCGQIVSFGAEVETPLPMVGSPQEMSEVVETLERHGAELDEAGEAEFRGPIDAMLASGRRLIAAGEDDADIEIAFERVNWMLSAEALIDALSAETLREFMRLTSDTWPGVIEDEELLTLGELAVATEARALAEAGRSATIDPRGLCHAPSLADDAIPDAGSLRALCVGFEAAFDLLESDQIDPNDVVESPYDEQFSEWVNAEPESGPCSICGETPVPGASVRAGLLAAIETASRSLLPIVPELSLRRARNERDALFTAVEPEPSTVAQRVAANGGDGARVALREAQFDVGFTYALLVCT